MRFEAFRASRERPCREIRARRETQNKSFCFSNLRYEVGGQLGKNALVLHSLPASRAPLANRRALTLPLVGGRRRATSHGRAAATVIATIPIIAPVIPAVAVVAAGVVPLVATVVTGRRAIVASTVVAASVSSSVASTAVVVVGVTRGRAAEVLADGAGTGSL
jgi:hypothetical protein